MDMVTALPGTGLVHSGPTAVRRSQVACSLCRASKTRCVHDRAIHSACIRCTRFGLHCSYPTAPKKRGRPAKTTQTMSFHSETSNISSSSHDRPHETARSSFAGGPGNGFGEWDHPMGSGSGFNPFDTPLPSGHHDPQTHHQHQQHGPPHPGHTDAGANPHAGRPSTSSEPPSSTHHNRTEPAQTASTLTSPSNVTSPTHDRDRNLNLSEYLDPNDRVLQQHPPNVPFFLPQPSPDRPEEGGARDGGDEEAGFGTHSAAGQDPISLGMLSEAEAQALVHQFHDKFNHHVAVLDHQMHTLHYMRNHTIILLCAVLAATSKLYRKDLWPSLLSHANTVLDRALLRGTTHISLMQSLMILTYTKAPADTSAWRRIGMAIRMGYQMRLHVPRLSGLPDDVAAARVILNAERTWYCLFCFDRGLGHVFGLPYSIRLTEIGNWEAWAREHVHLGPSVDMHLAASIDLCRLKDQWRAVFDSQSPSPSYCESAIENLKVEAEAMYSRWFGRGAQPPGFDAKSEQVIAWCMLDFVLTLKRQHYELNPNLPMRLDACLSVASQIVDEIEELGRSGVLGVMQDTASCMTSSLGIFFHKAFPTATMTQKSIMVGMLQRVLNSHVAVINGDEKSAPAHVVRCIRRILGAIRAESRAGSPSAPGGGGAGGGAGGGGGGMGGMGMGEGGTGVEMTLEDIFGQFEDTFVPQDEGIHYSTGDEQFWQMLFSAQ